MSLPDDNGWWHGGSPLSFDASERGLFNGNFLPPPPRPPFLDDSAQFDGLTTCGMCSWATKSDPFLAATNNAIDSHGDWGFRVLIGIVSVLSALAGAFAMVFLLKCRRLKARTSQTMSSTPWCASRGRPAAGGSMPGSGTATQQRAAKHGTDTIRVAQANANNGVWTWLGQRRLSGAPDPLSQPSSSPAENHYTHMDDSYNPELGEALYAELDRESLQSGNPSYQNTAYSGCGEPDKELQMFSSAPSSAYYSDLSVATTTVMPVGERTYEVPVTNSHNCCSLLESEPECADGQPQFGMSLLSPHSSNTPVGRRAQRLSAINEGGHTGSSSSSSARCQQPSEFV